MADIRSVNNVRGEPVSLDTIISGVIEAGKHIEEFLPEHVPAKVDQSVEEAIAALKGFDNFNPQGFAAFWLGMDLEASATFANNPYIAASRIDPVPEATSVVVAGRVGQAILESMAS